MLAQQRGRIFLRGLRTSIAPQVPTPLSPFGNRTLQEFLDESLPCIDRNSLTACMQKNLMGAEVVMKQMLTDGKVEPTDLLVFPLDRADGKVYQRRYSINLVPTLTTTNKYLFVASLDFHRKDAKRKCFRFLHPSETWAELAVSFFVCYLFNLDAMCCQIFWCIFAHMTH